MALSLDDLQYSITEIQELAKQLTALDAEAMRLEAAQLLAYTRGGETDDYSAYDDTVNALADLHTAAADIAKLIGGRIDEAGLSGDYFPILHSNTLQDCAYEG